MKILAAIPCYNEEATIGSVVLKAKRHVDEVLVIDDGSIDDTARVAEEAGAVVIKHKENKGKAFGVKNAFKYALENDFDVVVAIDGDGQHDADEIPNLLKPVLEGKADMSIGFRFGRLTEMPLWRKVGKRVLDYATGVGAQKITDSQCGFRLIRIEKLGDLILTGKRYELESELIILAGIKGWNIDFCSIPVIYNGSGSSINRTVDTLRFCKMVVKMVGKR